jgi:hypothetical protein
MLLQFDGLTARLAKLRDWVIGAAANYLVGHVVVATYAVRNDFGIIKALDTQYIVAGLVPTFVLCLTSFAWLAGNQRGEKVAEVVSTQVQNALLRGEVPPSWIFRFLYRKKRASLFWISRVRRKYLLRHVGPFYLLAVALIAVAALLASEWQQLVPLVFVAALVAMLALIYASRVGNVIDRRIFQLEEVRPLFPIYGALTRWFSQTIAAAVFMGIYMVPLYFAFFFLYVDHVLPAIPLEFGGAAKRCVAVVLKDPATGKVIGGDAQPPGAIDMILELSGDRYVLSTERDGKRRIWLVPRDGVVTMGTC